MHRTNNARSKLNSNTFPKSINIRAKAEKNNSQINTNIDSNLVSKIQSTSKTFELLKL